MGLIYDTEKYAVPIAAPESVRINNKNLRGYGFELDTLPDTLFNPPVRPRLTGDLGLNGNRDSGNTLDNWRFQLRGRIHGLTKLDVLNKRDLLLAWIDDQQYVHDEFITSNQSAPFMYFELCGHKWYYTQEVLLVENGSKTVYGGRRQVTSGTTTSTTSDKLVDSGATFTSDDIEVGDVVFNTTDTTGALITAIDSDTTLSIDRDIMASGESYQIYDNPKWSSMLKEDNDFRISGDTTKYKIESLTDDGKLVLDTAVVRASASSLTYNAERRRYLLVSLDGTGSNSNVGTRGFMSHDGVDKTISTRGGSIIPITINFRTTYPHWIGDCVITDFGQVNKNSFVELRGSGLSNSKPIYNVRGVATNPSITAAEYAFHSVFNCNVKATDVRNISLIEATIRSEEENAISGLLENAFTFAANTIFSVDAMNDGTAPTGDIADKINRNQGKFSVWVKPNWNSADDTTDRYVFKDSASTNEFTIMWDGTNKQWEASDGTNTATSADTFSSGTWINIQVAWSDTDNVEGVNQLQIWIDGTAGTGAGSYLSDTPGTLLYVGGQSGGTLGFTGDMDDLGIWNYWEDPENSSEVSDIYNSGSGDQVGHYRPHELILHLPMDTSTNPPGSSLHKTLLSTSVSTTAVTVAKGGVRFSDGDPVLVSDEAGHHVFGVVNGMPSDTSIPVDDGFGNNVTDLDRVGASASFDGSTDYYTATSAVGNVSTGDWAICAFVKTTASGSTQIIASKVDALSGNVGWYLGIDSSGNPVMYRESSTATDTDTFTTFTVNDGKWHFIAFYNDRSGGSSRFQVDGEEQNISTVGDFSGHDISNAVAFRIGALGDGGASNKFTGNIKNVRFYGDGSTTFMTTSVQEDIFEIGAFGLDQKNVSSRAEDAWYKLDESGITTDADDSSSNNIAATASGTPTRDVSLSISDNLVVDSECELGPQAGWGLNLSQNIDRPIFNDWFKKKSTTSLYKDSNSIEFASSGANTGFYKKVIVPKGTNMMFGFSYLRTTGGFDFQAYDATLAAVTDDNGSFGELEDNTSTWQHSQHYVEVDNSGSDLHTIELRFNGQATAEEHHLDSMFCKVTPLPNGHAGDLATWNEDSGSGSLSLTSTNEHAGDEAISADGTTDGAISDFVTLKSNQWYSQVSYQRVSSNNDVTTSINSLNDPKGDTSSTFSLTTLGNEINDHNRVSILWRTTASVSGKFRVNFTPSMTVLLDDLAFIERGNIDTSAVSVSGSGTLLSATTNGVYIPGCNGCAVNLADLIYLDYTDIVRGYRKKMGFVCKTQVQFASDDANDHYLFSWFDDSSGANAFKLCYDASDDDWVIIIKSAGVNDTTLRTTNTQTFKSGQSIVVAGWYDSEGRIDFKDGTRYYGKIFVNGMQAGTITTAPTVPAADMNSLYVSSDGPTTGSFGVSAFDELALFVYAPSDENLVAYSRNKMMINNNATSQVFTTGAANDIIMIDTRTGITEHYDQSAQAMLDVDNIVDNGRNAGVRGTGDDEYQTLFVTSDSANISDLEATNVPHWR